MKKRLLALAAASACLLLSPAAHAQRIAVSVANSGPWLSLVGNGIKSYAAQQKGVDLKVEDAQDDISRQLNQIQNFIAQKVDAIIVVTVDTQATPKMTRMATAAGIPLVYVNHPPAEDKLPPKVVFVGSNEVDSGTLQTREVCRLLGGKGNVLVMIGDLSNQSALQRTQDVKDVIAKPPCAGMKIVAEQSADWSRVKGADLMSNWITAGLHFDAVIANNDEMAIGAIQSLKSARKLDKVVVAGVDATQDALSAMKAGDLKVTVFQDAIGQGRGAVDAALKLAKGQPVPSKVWVPFELVTPANMDRYSKKN
ncbi:MAG: hypothetical protein RJA36_1204 [Pseudomonadota bacterium]